jgi:hypothetical protein
VLEGVTTKGPFLGPTVGAALVPAGYSRHNIPGTNRPIPFSAGL